METLVFFLAIGAIQLIASYIKQKKEKEEAARKATQRSASPVPAAPRSAPQRSAPPPQAQPMPDPLKDLMRQLGVPEVAMAPAPAPAPPPPPAPRHEARRETVEDYEVPDRKIRAFEAPKHAAKPAAKAAPIATPKPVEVLQENEFLPGESQNIGDLGLTIEDGAKAPIAQRSHSVHEYANANDLRKGMVWGAILQEPRFRRPWTPAHR